MRIIFVFTIFPVAFADPLKCGVGTNQFPECPRCMETAVKAGILDFWWNWDSVMTIDVTELSPSVVPVVQKAFTPMLWGQGVPAGGYGFLKSGNEWMLGYNEPDQYGPWCAGPASRGTFGCSGGSSDYRSASSDGWQPAFDPYTAAPLWQTTINDMVSAPEAQGGTVQKIAAPSMAQPPAPVDDCSGDPAGGGIKYCRGWMQSFKKVALTLQCKNFKGQTTNCWDVIDAIPIHAYSRTAAGVKQKIKEYYMAFQDDFEGINGRTKKTLWLTEVAAGSNDATFITKFVDDLMNPSDGLTNRDLFGYVEKVSWFSEWAFGSFKVGNYTPSAGEMWSSSLFVPTSGELTPGGEHFATYCSGAVTPSPAPPAPAPTPTTLKCGVGTNQFPECPKCLDTLMSAGLDFWWNWDTDMHVDITVLSPSTVAAAQKAFTPMLWGQGAPSHGYGFLLNGNEWVLGYNEPDQHGPACAGPASAGVFGCSGGSGDYRAATSDGWLPAFNPLTAAPLWQSTINDMVATHEAPDGTVRKIAAPSMAQPATPVDDCSKDPSVEGNIKFCHGWMQGFKKATLLLQCKNFKGQTTNCWDVIEAIPIHAYARTAAEVKQKIQEYHQIFQEDFEGTNGRTKKTLWLTEVAAGTNDATFLTQFVDDLMNPSDGLTNRDLFGYVEKVSWFSEWLFGSFKVGSYTPQPNEMWSSSLFAPTTGELTQGGEHFFAYCGGKAPTMTSLIV